MTTQAFWLRRRYSLSPRDPRFLALTPLEVATDFWAHQFIERPETMNDYETEGYDLDDMNRRLDAGEDWEDVLRV